MVQNANNINSEDQMCKRAKNGHWCHELLDLQRVADDSDNGEARDGVDAYHRTGDNAKEKTRGGGRTLRWLELAVTEDSGTKLVDLKQSRHPWNVTVNHPPYLRLWLK
ncbi:hypothetical protein Bca4012_024234 [Brassica carinata]|uniref:Uncharacterized protein n=1 Tax=Brassica carinata TaxID=52824 RepID=A0A8X7NYF0_BRACI|nr:hypothetical protein Bca52824_095771 [Brassica carinata]